MGGGPLGKESGGAIHVSNESGGEGRVLARGPDAETDRLVDGGRRGTGHADKHGGPESTTVNRVEVWFSVVIGNIRPPSKSTGKVFPVRAIVRLKGTEHGVQGSQSFLVP
eukprot:803340-Alexandrium_andersonii.AAC.1